MNKIKQWILNRKFFNDYVTGLVQRERERNLGELYIKAFTSAQKDLKETITCDIDKKAKELADKMLNEMLSVVDENKIISVNPRGMVYIGGEQADEAYLMNLKSEAEMIESTNLWTILIETPKKLAQEAMFVKGETLADMTKGKSMLYLLATQKKIIETIKSYKNK